MADKTVAQLLSEATTYNDKVDVLVALASATVDDSTATEVAEGIALQKAVGESTDDAVLNEALADAKARVDSLQTLRDARDAVQGDGEYDENVSASGSDVSDVEGVDEDSAVGPVDSAEDDAVERDSAPQWGNPEAS